MVKSYLKKSVVVGAAAVAIVGLAGVASAGKINDTALTGKKIALQTNKVTKGLQPTAVDFEYTYEAVAPAPVLAVGDYIVLEVKGGGIFNAVPSLYNSTAAPAVLIPGSLNADKTQAKYVLGAAPAANDVYVFHTDAAAGPSQSVLDLSALPLGAGAQLSVSAVKAGVNIDGTPLTMTKKIEIVNAFEPDGARRSITDILDIATLNTKFTGDSLTSSFGFGYGMQIKNMTTSQAILPQNLVCIQRGDYVGIKELVGAWGPIEGSSELGVPVTGAVAGTYAINKAKTAAAATLTGPAVFGGGASINTDVPYTLDGTTTQKERSFTGECNLLTYGTFEADDTLFPAQMEHKFVDNSSNIFLTYSNALNNNPNEQAIVIRELNGPDKIAKDGAKIFINVITPGETNGEGTESGLLDTGMMVQGFGTLIITPGDLLKGAGVDAANNQQIRIKVASSAVTFTSLHGSMGGWSNNNGTNGTM